MMLEYTSLAVFWRVYCHPRERCKVRSLVLVEPNDGQVVSGQWINQGGEDMGWVLHKPVSGGSIFIDFTYQLSL